MVLCWYRKYIQVVFMQKIVYVITYQHSTDGDLLE